MIIFQTENIRGTINPRYEFLKPNTFVFRRYVGTRPPEKSVVKKKKNDAYMVEVNEKQQMLRQQNHNKNPDHLHILYKTL